MGLYLAVDAGGTKTECVIADDERILARLEGPTIKIMNVGAPEATTRLRQILHDTAGRAGIPLYLVNRACMGLAGIGSEGVRTWAEATMAELLPGEILLAGDEEIALEAAFGQGPGILIIAGTGSHVIGRSARGSRFTSGGWGPMLGDEGSGFWIGLEGLRAALRALDRGAPSQILREVQQAWEISTLAALIARANNKPRPDFAALAAPIARCAATGDAIAISVLQSAGEELANLVGLVLAKMRGAACTPAETSRVAFTGSVLGKIPAVHAAMREALRLAYPNLALDDVPIQPIDGALGRARRRR